jgi:GNAT superfamily N-acetyltransferase
MSIEIVPFTDDHLENAASMVAARYQAERNLKPSLPVRFGDSASVLPLLRKLAQSGPGIAGIRDGEFAGFLLASLALLRGIRTAYSPDFGHAAHAACSRDIYRSMYASLSRGWLAHGCFSHAITFFASEREAIDTWFSLGFGLIVIDALRDVSPPEGRIAAVEIRAATPEDVDLIMTLELPLRRHLAAAPVFLPLIMEKGRESRERWLSDPAKRLWLASQDGAVTAYMSLEPSRSEVMPISNEATVAITGAYTREGLRGRGIGTALLSRALDWARSAGYQHCSVDFESANIPGSRFWLRKGFRPVCYSLCRRIDSRLAWANEDRPEGDLVRAYEGQVGVG